MYSLGLRHGQTNSPASPGFQSGALSSDEGRFGGHFATKPRIVLLQPRALASLPRALVEYSHLKAPRQPRENRSVHRVIARPSDERTSPTYLSAPNSRLCLPFLPRSKGFDHF